jgi:hypothetical protein
MIRAASIQSEYFMQRTVGVNSPLPGTLQYRETPESILGLQLAEDDDDCGYKLCEHSIENLKKITPRSKKNKNYRIILMMKKHDESTGETWLKVALLDIDTMEISLLTSTNSKHNLEIRGNRPVKTVDGNWFVGQYRMSAPVAFWRELQNRLMY